MRILLSLVIGTVWVFTSPACGADDFTVHGVVIDPDGSPVEDANVCKFWRANGSVLKSDGKPFDLSDEQNVLQFWGNLGDMQPFANSESIATTDQDGRFDVQVSDGVSRVVMAMDSARRFGGIAEIPSSKDSDLSRVRIRLKPLITVRGRMTSVAERKTVNWSHVYVNLPENPSRPLLSDRLVSCGSFDGRFEFNLPPGTYRLDAYAVSDPVTSDIDLRVTPQPSFTIDGSEAAVELGVLELEDALSRSALEAEAKASRRWKDYTKHFGEAAPNWHASDVRGIDDATTVADFRGKWLMIYFWGPSCRPCMATGIPKLVDFYEDYEDYRTRFEIVGVCIDFFGEIHDMTDLETTISPYVTSVWEGREIEFPIVLDTTFQSWERFGIPGLGTIILVDPDGNLVDGDDKTLAGVLKRDDASIHSESTKAP
jgi:thiol-disulfide isomerase/thioredoxin